MELPITDPVLIFALMMVTILVAPLLFQRLKMPGLLGLLCAGTLVGPSVLGLLVRDETIVLLGTVGLVYLMFVAGLSLDLSGFKKVRKKSIGFGLLSFTAPLLLALLAGMTVLKFSFFSSLLLGSIVGSHTLLAYPIVSRLGISKNTGVTLAMGGTLVTDIASLGLLAVVIGATSGEAGLGFWLLFFAKVTCFVVGIYVVLPRLGRWFFRHAQYDTTTDYLFMVSTLFVTAFLAELAGLAPIIGAFLAGLLLNRLVPESSTLMSRIQFVGDALLVPFFLVSVGMLVDVSVLGSALVWIKALTFTLLVLVGKGAATLAGEKLFGFTASERWVILGLTTPQAAATLAVTLLGFENGLLGRSDVNSVILMILMTCLIGTTLVEKFGRDVAQQEQDVPYDPADAPQRILVPLANPETANHLMSIAFMVKDSGSPEPLYPLTVTVGSQNGEVASEVARSEKMLSSAAELAASAEVEAIPITRIDFNIAKGIGRAISERRISSVIIGWNGQVTTQRRIFGSVLDQLLEETDVLVLVCKISKPINLFKRILIALPPLASWETCFPAALRSVKQMAEQLGVRPVFIHSQAKDSQLKERVSNVKPELEADWEGLEHWKELPSWLEAHRREDDLFVLMSARKGAVSWRSSLDTLPAKIAIKFPDLCFLVVYPAELDWRKSKHLL